MVKKIITYFLILLISTLSTLDVLASSSKTSEGLTEMQIIQGLNGIALGALLPVAIGEEINILWMIPAFTVAGIALPNSYSKYNSISQEAARFTTFMTLLGTGEAFLLSANSQDEELAVFWGDLLFTFASFTTINLIGTPTYGQTASIVSGAVMGGLLGLAFTKSPFVSKISKSDYLNYAFWGSVFGFASGLTLATTTSLSLQKVWTLNLGLVLGASSGILLSYLFELNKKQLWFFSLAMSGLGLWASIEVTKNWSPENRLQVNSNENVLQFNLPGYSF